MANFGFAILLLAFLLLIGVLLFIPMRWLAMRSIKDNKEAPKGFDPKRTRLSGVEILALVIPLVSATLGMIAAIAIYALAVRDELELPEWVKWAYLLFIAAFAVSGHKIGDSISRRLLRRAESPLAEDAQSQ